MAAPLRLPELLVFAWGRAFILGLVDQMSDINHAAPRADADQSLDPQLLRAFTLFLETGDLYGGGWRLGAPTPRQRLDFAG